MADDQVIKILDVKINALKKAEVLNLIKILLSNSNSGQQQLVTTNPEFIMAAQKDTDFKNIINNSWLSVADGYGIKLAGQYQQAISNFQFPISKIKKLFIGLKIAYLGITRNYKKLNTIPETITGTDLVPEITRIMNYESRIKNKKIFLLGGYADTPRLAVEQLKTALAVWTNDYSPLQENVLIKFSYSTFESPNIIEKINSFEPLVLFVALNHPRAQKWINDNLPKMPSVKLAIGVGGAFDYLSGKIKRAPQNLSGFEWLYRLFTQPRRFKRIFIAVIKFPWAVFKSKIKTLGN